MHFSDTNSISKKHFVEFGKRIGLPEKLILKTITQFSSSNSKVDTLINQSFLSEQLKKDYKYSYHFRQFLLGND